MVMCHQGAWQLAWGSIVHMLRTVVQAVRSLALSRKQACKSSGFILAISWGGGVAFYDEACKLMIIHCYSGRFITKNTILDNTWLFRKMQIDSLRFMMIHDDLWQFMTFVSSWWIWKTWEIWITFETLENTHSLTLAYNKFLLELIKRHNPSLL